MSDRGIDRAKDGPLDYDKYDTLALQHAVLLRNYLHYLIGQGITERKEQRVYMAIFAQMLAEASTKQG